MNGAHPLLKFISLSSWVSMKSSVVSRNDNVHALTFTRYLCFQWFSKHFFIIVHEYLFLAKHYGYCSLKFGK